MGNQKKNRRAFFKDLAKVCVASSFITRSALSFNDLFVQETLNFSISTDYPICLSLRYSFPGTKTEIEVLEEMREFSSVLELKKIIENFEKAGKMSSIRHFKTDQNSIEFKIYFKNQQALSEYQETLSAMKVIDIQERDKRGYYLTSSVFNLYETII